ncbi:MAG: Crp/Fnr family transcriptional regulator [Myxococcota bacterium]
MTLDDRLFARFGRECPAGTVLFREGDPGDTMFVVQVGTVRITKRIRDEERTLARLGSGEFLGEMALLNHKSRTATAQVVEDSRLLELDAQTFETMISSNAEIAVRLIQKLAHRLDSADALIEILMNRDPKARIILCIAREAEFNGRPQGDSSVLVTVDSRGICEQTQAREREVLSVIHRLSRLGILEIVDEGFLVPDVMRLHEFLQFLQR